MKTLHTMTAALALLVGAGAANGADVYSSGGMKDGAVLTNAVDFGGFYASVGAGASVLSGSGSFSETAIRGDVRAGWDHLTRDGWIVGLWGDVSVIDFNKYGIDMPIGYGAGVKVGHTVGSATELYIVGGYQALSLSSMARLDGVLGGVGAETFFAQHWSLGAEADFVSYSLPSGTSLDDIRVVARTTFHVN